MLRVKPLRPPGYGQLADVLYARFRRTRLGHPSASAQRLATWAAYTATRLLHAALLDGSISGRIPGPGFTVDVIDCVKRGRPSGVRRKQLGHFQQDFADRYMGTMGGMLSPAQRQAIVTEAAYWTGVITRWRFWKYKQPNRNGPAYFSCIGLIEHCYENCGRDICNDTRPFLPIQQLRAFRADRYNFRNWF